MIFRNIRRLAVARDLWLDDDPFCIDGIRFWSFKNGQCGCEGQLHSTAVHLHFMDYQCLVGHDQEVSTRAECSMCHVSTPIFTGTSLDALLQHMDKYLELVELTDNIDSTTLDPVFKLEEVRLGPDVFTRSVLVSSDRLLAYHGYGEIWQQDELLGEEDLL